MFKALNKTGHPPKKPILIWDGNCGFCKYWMLVIKNNSDLEFAPYQESLSNFPDISKKEFQKASRLIDPDGRIYSGPDSAYKAMTYLNKPVYFFHKLYQNSSLFRWISNHGYNFISKNRPFMMRLTIFLFGRNPINRKPYWLIPLAIVIVIILVALFGI